MGKLTEEENTLEQQIRNAVAKIMKTADEKSSHAGRRFNTATPAHVVQRERSWEQLSAKLRSAIDKEGMLSDSERLKALRKAREIVDIDM